MFPLRHLATKAPTALLSRTFALAAPELSNAGGLAVNVYNPSGKKRVLVTKPMPGDRYLEILIAGGNRVEVCALDDPASTILSNEQISTLIGDSCDAVIGQLTEDWNDDLFSKLKKAGGKAFSNMAVGYNNVDVDAATKHGIPVGNTPGVLTETTAEIGAALTLSAARRIVEADNFMRSGKYLGWLPTLFVGKLLQQGTVGIIGCGRIGQAYARMMIEGHKMNVVYYDLMPQPEFESFVNDYSKFLVDHGEDPITVTRAETIDELLPQCDVVSLHTVYNASTKHLMNAKRLKLMKESSVLVNTARGPVIDETALVAHLQANPNFSAALDVFEDEPAMAPGLAECENAVILPHIASASMFTRGGMATLAACNVAARLQGNGVWETPDDVKAFLSGDIASIPQVSPSIVNAKELGIE
jgi:hydroxypyruvate reductase 1